MIDPNSLSDEELEKRFKKAHKRDDIAVIVCVLQMIGCLGIGLGAGFCPPFLALAGSLLGTLGLAQINQSYIMNPCGAERKRRQEVKKQQAEALKAIAEGKSPMAPGVSGAFNPSAATVLDSNLRPMAPLRLKAKNRFAYYL